MIGATLRPLAIVAWLALLIAVPGARPAVAQDDDPADPGPIPGGIGEPALPLDEKRLYDMANLLSNAEEWQIETDAARLAEHGIPSAIIVQASDLTPEQAATFADEIRQAWGVETSPGADDGLVMLVTVDLTDESTIFPVLSWGENALPHFGVDQATSNRVEAEWLNTYLQAGEISAAIDYSLRRLIYHSIYDPAPQQALTSTQATARNLTTVLAPLVAIGAVALAFTRLRRSQSPARRPGADLPLTWGVLIAASILGGLAVWSRSEWGALAALVLLGVAVAGWIRNDPEPRRVALNGAQDHARP